MRQMDRHTDSNMHKQTDRHTGRHTDSNMHKQTDRQTGRHKDSNMHKQTDRQTVSGPVRPARMVSLTNPTSPLLISVSLAVTPHRST
jgi:hypothetical protein